jgi:UDP-glucose 4-epimerase
MLIVVTGVSGFIGGQTALHLREKGHAIIGIDTQSCSQPLMKNLDRFYQEDFSNHHGLSILDRTRPDTIIHCAGTSLVGPSFSDPRHYYQNNFVNTKKLLDYLLDKNIRSRIIFSSSAAIYGEPKLLPCQEDQATIPISAYGESKLMVEMMLHRYHVAYGLDYVALRYFNACGADPWGRHGQKSGATHIVARILESAKNSQKFHLYGNDYDTPDGTCIRDYLHVEDIARAHAMSLDVSVSPGSYNLGTSVGTSNQDIITTCEKIIGKKIHYEIRERRPGDPDRLTATADKFSKASRWKIQYSIDDMIKHAWAWYNR